MEDGMNGFKRLTIVLKIKHYKKVQKCLEFLSICTIVTSYEYDSR